ATAHGDQPQVHAAHGGRALEGRRSRTPVLVRAGRWCLRPLPELPHVGAIVVERPTPKRPAAWVTHREAVEPLSHRFHLAKPSGGLRPRHARGTMRPLAPGALECVPFATSSFSSSWASFFPSSAAP